MKRHHKLLAVGSILFLVGWLSWTVLLTASEVARPLPDVEQSE